MHACKILNSSPSRTILNRKVTNTATQYKGNFPPKLETYGLVSGIAASKFMLWFDSATALPKFYLSIFITLPYYY